MEKTSEIGLSLTNNKVKFAETHQQEGKNSGDTFFKKNSTSEDNINDKKDAQKAEVSPITKFFQLLFNNTKYQIFITILTVYSLYADDLRTAFFDQTKDPIFDWLNLLVMCIFMVELILSSIVVEDYFLSFYFFLDVISTISIIFDINFITNQMFSTTTSSSVSQLASQSKASRAATRAVRIIKLVRIIRILKVYKNAQKAKELKEEKRKMALLKEKLIKKRKAKMNDSKEPQMMGVSNENNTQTNFIAELKLKQGVSQMNPPQPQQVQRKNTINNDLDSQKQDEQAQVQISQDELAEFMTKQSKIGKILSDLSIKKIVIVVLLMMFILPLMNIDLYRDPQSSWDYVLEDVNALLRVGNNMTLTTINAYIENQINEFKGEDDFIIQFMTPFNELPSYDQINIDQLRTDDLISSEVTIDTSYIMSLHPTLTLSGENPGKLTAVLNQNKYSRIAALFSIGKTTFICLVLFLLMYLFNSDIDTYIVDPIQSMMLKLTDMAKDPQSAAKEELNPNTELQTTVISNAIIKIGALLSTVFGSAGAQIIGSNIIQEGDMNPMIQGKKKCAIFGFCDIRNFTQYTDVLQEEILIFVNKIGSLVHESVYRYGGGANKNIGEAFLMVWKIPYDKYDLDLVTNKVEWKDKKYLSVLSDFAVLGFVKTLVKINKDPLVLQYRNDSRLINKIKKFKKVQMGFGLHIGWAIEGAIGSQYKIDASYLSPNVNMAARLQAATKQFGVDYLISQDLYELLTAEMKEFCRKIDRVTVKGSEKPINLYTIDLCYDRITPPMNKELKYPNVSQIPDSESKRSLNMAYLQDDIELYNARKFIEGKKELREVMLDAIPIEFKKRFQLGVTCYLLGKWSDSRLHLSEALKFRVNDGPTRNLLNYMKKQDYKAPSTWENYRPLTSK